MIWSLFPASAIYGIVAALVFRRFSDNTAIRRTANRMMAHVLEFRLFLDSPALVFRAQRDLARENFRLLRLILLPCAIMATIFIIMFPQLDAMYGHAPLKTGERAIVTVQLKEEPPPALNLEAPPGIEIQTPGVLAVHDRQVSWRIRPLGRAAGELKVRTDGRVLTRQIIAGSSFLYGVKLPFMRPAIEIRYPRITVLGLNWMVWFFLISSAVAIGHKT